MTWMLAPPVSQARWGRLAGIERLGLLPRLCPWVDDGDGLGPTFRSFHRPGRPDLHDLWAAAYYRFLAAALCRIAAAAPVEAADRQVWALDQPNDEPVPAVDLCLWLADALEAVRPGEPFDWNDLDARFDAAWPGHEHMTGLAYPIDAAIMERVARRVEYYLIIRSPEFGPTVPPFDLDELLKAAIDETVGYPWRPGVLPQWRTETVLSLAKRAWDHRAFDLLPIVADALQDAGCWHSELLDHLRGNRLRGPSEHTVGCWALVDLLLPQPPTPSRLT